MDSEEIHHLTCVQCGRPVRLQNAKTDELGHTVHLECYELRLYGEQSKWPEAYCKAMWGLETALLDGRILDARAEIAERLVELNYLPGLHAEEHQAIREVLEGLRSLELEDQRHKAAEVAQAAWEKLSSISPRFAPKASNRP